MRTMHTVEALNVAISELRIAWQHSRTVVTPDQASRDLREARSDTLRDASARLMRLRDAIAADN